MQVGKSRRFTIMSAASMLMMLSCLGHGWAQTLNGPYGLALDAKGNLYVANMNSDQVLVYNPNYLLQTTKSITSGLSAPTGVAFDSKGNVYVANFNTNSVTQYSPAGVLNTRFSISGLAGPRAMAVDGVDDLYVLNSGSSITNVYPLADTINGPNLLTSFTPSGSPFAYAIAVHAGDLYIGTTADWEKGFISELLAGGGRFPVIQSTNGFVVALATDGAGDLYVGSCVLADPFKCLIDPVTPPIYEVDFWSPKGGPVVFLKQLGFAPAGMVVDSARGRVYLSNHHGNQVLVYSTTGTLLHTIQ